VFVTFLGAVGVRKLFIEPGAPWRTPNPFAATFHARVRAGLNAQESF